MSPENLAKYHSQIIDAKLADLKELFKSVNVETDSKVKELFNGLELDNSGMVKKSAKNRRIMNYAVGIIRRKTKSLRPVVFGQYEQAVEQINNLSTEYITWLRENPR